jgi:hypothetical protein
MAYFEQTKVTDPIGNVINPATEESIILLRRMVKLLESQNATDIANRQRMTLDSIAAGLTLGTVTGVTTVGAVTSITNALPTGTNSIGFVNQDLRQFIDVARNNYANSIRNKLTFS